MSETPKEAKHLRESLSLHWSEARQEQLGQRIATTYRRRRTAKRAVAMCAVVLAVAVGYAWQRQDGRQSTLPDGSTIARLDAATRVTISEQTAEQVAVRLERGRARFSVARNPKRTFKVHAGDVGVEVVGTVFEVDRQDGHTRITVSEGKVLVTRGGFTALVGAGESRDLDTTVPPPIPQPEAPSGSPEAPEPPPDDAPSTVEKHRPSKPSPTMAEVLSEVDGLRLANKAKAAAALLRRALNDRPNDALAPQAQFLLGRVLQDDLHQPVQAAAAFAALRKHAPRSVLAEDALARQVECLVAAGTPERARELVRVYEETYQRGVHTARLRKLVAPQ